MCIYCTLCSSAVTDGVEKKGVEYGGGGRRGRGDNIGTAPELDIIPFQSVQLHQLTTIYTYVTIHICTVV